MKTLFIDTHNEIIKIILFKNGKVVDLKEKESSMKHSVYTMPLIEEVLKNNNLDSNDINEIIVVNGPGSFTGVRIGVTIAKTYSYLLNIPIKVINVLEMKAIFVNGDKKVVIEEEKNGKFIAEAKLPFDNCLASKIMSFGRGIKVISPNLNSDTDKNDNEISIVDNIDYEKVYEYLKTKESINPHAVNPLYIKKIEVMK